MKKTLSTILLAAAGISLLAGFSGCADNSSDGIKLPADTGTDLPVSTATGNSGVMLQGFNWHSCNVGNWYNVVSNNASSIKNTFTYVWCPPPSDSGSENGYHPRQLNYLNSSYGTEAQLKSMISSLSPAKAIADIVINHRVGSTCWGDFTNPDFGTSKGSNYQAICSDDEGFVGYTDSDGVYHSGDSHMTSVSSSMRGAADTGDSYGSARDLDHTNATVQSGIKTWMNDVLKNEGFVGWRYDFVKGYGGQYVGMYNSATSAVFSVGEYWPTSSYNSALPSAWGDALKNWVSATETGGYRSKVFDFTLKGAMNTVFGTTTGATNSNYSLLADVSNIYISQPEDSVTFVDNHDTGSTQSLWPLDSDDVGTAYALILTHPGFPCVAWQHYFTASESSDSGTQYMAGNTVSGTTNTLRQHIDKLINYRGYYGINYKSTRTTLAASSNVYAAKIDGTMGSLIVAIGNGYSVTGSGYSLLYYGDNFMIWGSSYTGNMTFTATDVSWIWNDSCTIFAKVTDSSGNVSWIQCTGYAASSSKIYAAIPDSAAKVKFVRCQSGTTVETVASAEPYNTSAEVTITSGTTEYTVSWSAE